LQSCSAKIFALIATYYLVAAFCSLIFFMSLSYFSWPTHSRAPGTIRYMNHHVPRYGLPAPFAVHVRFIRPYLVLLVAEDANQVFGRRDSLSLASGAALFHIFILPLTGGADYEIDLWSNQSKVWWIGPRYRKRSGFCAVPRMFVHDRHQFTLERAPHRTTRAFRQKAGQ